MVPPNTHPKWAALVQGRIEYKFSNAAASMLLWRLKGEVKKDTSAAALNKAIGEMHAFCTKYQGFLLADLQSIFN
jgi:hypothetical protein